jgi:hypothetical protein
MKNLYNYVKAIYRRAFKRCFACGSMVLPFLIVRCVVRRTTQRTIKKGSTAAKDNT